MNLFFLALGGAVIYIGTTYSSNTSTTDDPYTIGVTMISIGVFSVILGLFGLFGAFCQSRCLLITYLIVLSLLLIAQCVVAGMSINISGNSDRMSEYAELLWQSSSDYLRNQFQKAYHCCGFGSIMDRPGSACDPSAINMRGLFGCKADLVEVTTATLHRASALLFAAAGIELIAVIIALVLVYDRKYKHGYGYTPTY